jgi:hypothetical protein
MICESTLRCAGVRAAFSACNVAICSRADALKISCAWVMLRDETSKLRQKAERKLGREHIDREKRSQNGQALNLFTQPMCKSNKAREAKRCRNWAQKKRL